MTRPRILAAGEAVTAGDPARPRSICGASKGTDSGLAVQDVHTQDARLGRGEERGGRLRRGALASVAGLALGCLVLTGLAGCAPDGVPGGAVTHAPTPAPDVLHARQQAGIPPCPESDPDVPARADGLPDVTLECIGGDSAVRLAGLRGRPMIVNVWAQWCEPCRTEAPYLAEFGRDMGHPPPGGTQTSGSAPDVLILGIDYNDPLPVEAIEFARDAGWGWPHLADPDKTLAGPLQIAGPPQTFFVSADGVVVHRHVGAFTSTRQLADLAEQYLGVGP
jgi:thiol-disulfide isomerase/thioredoxin